jgi:glycosyltransferase involved in cell wall biosynthesis
MKIIVHDYVGHPFQVYLSRHLAKRGHEVVHMYFLDNPGPKGSLNLRLDDPPNLSFHGITLGGPINQNAFIARQFNDIAYGKKAAHVINGFKPDVVISGNTPTEAQQRIIKSCKANGSRFVFWVQDVYGLAVSKLLAKKFGLLGKAIGWYFQMLDRRQFHQSDAIVLITEGYRAEVEPWSGADKITVIENWASLDDIAPGTKNNPWARYHHLDQVFTYLYSGTLGRKHNPELLLQLAETDQVTAVVGQGYGMENLQRIPENNRPKTLKLLPLQAAQDLPNVLATADVLVATIEQDAGQFAVPSKIQSYLCAGRPILLAAPKNNLAALTVVRANAGIVVEPDDVDGFIDAAKFLFGNAQLRTTMGANGRAYAEQAFNMQRITDRFESVLVGEAA